MAEAVLAIGVLLFTVAVRLWLLWLTSKDMEEVDRIINQSKGK